jgi:nucleoside-diphosphate-sugar epimerase
VFHLASLFLATHTPEDVRPLVESNILFGAQLLEAMARTGCNKLVNTGTSWQHYHSDDYVPVCLYAATKQAFEDVAWYYVHGEGLRLITLKLFDTYGPGDRRPKLFNALRNAARRGEELAMSAGEQLVDLVYVEDVTRAFLVAAEMVEDKETAPEAYAISSGKPRPLREIVETYARVTGVPIRVHWGARPYRTREVMMPWTAGKRLPSWTPEVSLEEGIRKMEGLMLNEVPA